MNRRRSAPVLGRSDVKPPNAFASIQWLATLDVAAPEDGRTPVHGPNVHPILEVVASHEPERRAPARLDGYGHRRAELVLGAPTAVHGPRAGPANKGASHEPGNIQHPTSNNQHPKPARGGSHWMFDVGCWMFRPMRELFGEFSRRLTGRSALPRTAKKNAPNAGRSLLKVIGITWFPGSRLSRPWRRGTSPRAWP